MRGGIQNKFAQIVWPFVFKAINAFPYFSQLPQCDQAAYSYPQNRTGICAALVAERDHRLRQLARVGFCLHECGAAEFHVEDERIQTFGEFLGRIEAVMSEMLGTVRWRRAGRNFLSAGTILSSGHR